MTGTVEGTIDQFLAYKRTLARKYRSEEYALRLFLRFASDCGVERLDQVTPVLLEEFLGSRPRSRPRSFNHLLGVLRCMFDWAVARELLATSPLTTRRRRVTSVRIPFLFNVDQARRLLDAAATLPDNPRAVRRGPTYRCIFALCYGLGLRAGEACGLTLGDVDQGRSLLVVRGGKFGKSRLVPHGPRMAEVLAEHVRYRRESNRAEDDRAPLFTFDGRRPVHPGTASQTFHHLIPRLDLSVPAGVSPPRLHDLRHSFAVACLLRWYREGLDPSAQLHQLSTFMGHVNPISTAVYLTITADLLRAANGRFEAFAEPAWGRAVP